MTPRKTLTALVATLALLALTATAQQPAAEKAPTLKKAEIKPTSASSGSEMYTSYCAACHGLNGKGTGPAAKALKAPLSDLTQLAKKNGGKYPAEHVIGVLRFGSEIPAHGTAEMPIWGPLLRSVSSADEAETKLRITNLVRYLESLQAK